MTEHISSSEQQKYHEKIMEGQANLLGNNLQAKNASEIDSCQWKALTPEKIREIAEEIKRRKTQHDDCAQNFVYGP